MKLFYWNCRGIGNLNTQYIFASFFCQYSPNFLYLVEPMVEFASIPFAFFNRLDLSLIALNDRVLPSIWVFGRSSTLAPSSIFIHDQHITFDVLLNNSL